MDVTELTFSSDTMSNGQITLGGREHRLSAMKVKSLVVPFSWNNINPRFQSGDSLVIKVPSLSTTTHVQIPEGSYNRTNVIDALNKAFISTGLPLFKASISPTDGRMTITSGSTAQFTIDATSPYHCKLLGFKGGNTTPATSQRGQSPVDLNGSAIHLVSHTLSSKFGNRIVNSWGQGTTARLLSIPLNATYSQNITYHNPASEYLGISRDGIGTLNVLERLDYIDFELRDSYNNVLFDSNTDELGLPWWLSLVTVQYSASNGQY